VAKIALNNIAQWLWVFYIYAFLGWCVEVVFHAVSEGRFVNRGFLNGPICPIYGFGVLIVVSCLAPFRENHLILFFGSVLLTSALELATGFVQERFFNDKWWDYSKEPLNLHGYVCLRFSLLWGLACILIVDVIFPLTFKLTELIPQTLGYVLLSFFLAVTVFDETVTLIETLKLKKKLLLFENTEKHIRMVSEGIGGVLASGALNTIEIIEDGRQAVGLQKAKVKSDFSTVQKRILNSYPRLKQGRYKDSIARIKQHFKNEEEKAEKHGPSSFPAENMFRSLPIDLYRSTFETVIDVLEARDEYTAGHSRRVSVLMHRFCEVLKTPRPEAEMFELAASLHDLGKVGIADATLNKCEKLDEDEWSEMRRHSDIGADIILKSGNLEQVAQIVRCHHEHWDGSGYPAGLAGEQIPKGAQMIALCDASDSMMIERVYRQAFDSDECKSEITNGRGTLFSPELTDVFLKNWDYLVADFYSNDGKFNITEKTSVSQD